MINEKAVIKDFVELNGLMAIGRKAIGIMSDGTILDTDDMVVWHERNQNTG